MRLLFPRVNANSLGLIMTPVYTCVWLGLLTGWGHSRKAEVLPSRPDSRASRATHRSLALPGHTS